MTESKYTDTIDWDRYWQDADESIREDTSPSADLVVEPFLEFLDHVGAPASYADVGCGPGDLAVAVAEAYPDTTVIGYDAAEAVIAENRSHVADLDLDLRFERATLPDFTPDRSFKIVSCLFTLCYVADVEAAVQSLYEAVAPGGYLVLHYHNRFAQAHYSDIAADPHAVLDEDSAWNPDTFAERFALVISGESLLSYERIHDLLGTWPQSVFSVAEEADRYGAHRYEPLVYIPK